MQIAASSPSFVRREDVSQENIEKEKEIYQKQALAAGKPEKIVERIVEGKLNKYYSEVCLYEQPFIKDSEVTVEELIKSKIAIVKENISVKRFARFKVGE
jgi:elongation factor Ts